jgi:DNA-binding XRE family transcriptional regulator
MMETIPCKMAMFVGLTVRRLRAQARMSQQELAAKCDLDRSYITLIEQGKKNPTLNILESIGGHLAQSSAHFFAAVAYDTQKTCVSMCDAGQCPIAGAKDFQGVCPTKNKASNVGLLFNSDAVSQVGGSAPTA